METVLLILGLPVVFYLGMEFGGQIAKYFVDKTME